MLGIGSAKNYPVNSQIPAVGAIVLFTGGKDGHAGFVTVSDGINFAYDEGNADNHGAIRLGTVGNIAQGNIKGFYIP